MSLRRPETRRLAAWLALVALAAWLAWPALHPVHVEGFSASIVALGVHMAEGTLSDFFPSQPMTTEYFGLTKLGAVLGVAGLVKLGLAGETAMRLLMALGTVMLLGGSARLVRYWSGASWLLVAATLVVIPGVFDSSFFFNDNVPGAGLLVAALAIFCERQGWKAALGVGAMIGLAIAVRTDLVLVTPAILLMAAERQPLMRAAASTLWVAVAAIATLWLVYASVGASPIDAVRVAAATVDLWARAIDLPRQFLSFLLFLGLPAMILALLGIRDRLAARDWRRLAVLLGVPLLINLALIGKIWEARQLLVLTPFLAALAALGGRALIDEWRRGVRVPPAVVAMVIAAALFAPPAVAYFSDGPRSVIGRVAAIANWNAWQRQVRGNFALIDTVVATAPRGRTLAVVTDYWDEDRYLHLELLARGFRPVAQPPECDTIGQSMARDGRTIVQISPHQTFLPNADALYEPRLLQLAMPCFRALRAPAILVASSARVARLNLPEEAAPQVTRPGDTRLAATALSLARIERLGRDYRRDSAALPPGKYRSVPDAIRATRATDGATLFR